jgi:hypothetical protein
MATLNEVKAIIDARFTLVKYQSSVPDGYGFDRVAFKALDVSSGAADEKVGYILIDDLGGPGEAAYEISGIDEFRTAKEELEAWITDYGSRPWARVLSVARFNPQYQTALVTVLTIVDANDGVIEVHAVGRTGSGTFISRKATNAPILI